MRDTINQGIVKTKATLRKNMLEKLLSRKVGTHSCEKIAKMLVEEDTCLPADKRSLEEILKMGNSINPMIQLTGDCPSNNQNNKMLVLDLQCWMGDDGTVWWEHYRKTMTNYLVMLECSAMPNQMKRTTLTQEGVKVLRNCRLDMSWEMKAVHLTDLSAR